MESTLTPEWYVNLTTVIMAAQMFPKDQCRIIDLQKMIIKHMDKAITYGKNKAKVSMTLLPSDFGLLWYSTGLQHPAINRKWKKLCNIYSSPDQVPLFDGETDWVTKKIKDKFGRWDKENNYGGYVTIELHEEEELKMINKKRKMDDKLAKTAKKRKRNETKSTFKVEYDLETSVLEITFDYLMKNHNGFNMF